MISQDVANGQAVEDWVQKVGRVLDWNRHWFIRTCVKKVNLTYYNCLENYYYIFIKCAI